MRPRADTATRTPRVRKLELVDGAVGRKLGCGLGGDCMRQVRMPGAEAGSPAHPADIEGFACFPSALHNISCDLSGGQH